MARKKKQRQRTGWVRVALVLLVVPLGVWFVAFLIWFNWYNVKGWWEADAPRTRAARPSDAIEKRQPARTQPQEKLFDEDRKKLEEIIKRRS